MKKKILNNKTEITEINNENNNPVATVNENLWLLLQMILMFILLNKLIIGIVHQFKNSNTQNDSKTIVKQSTNTKSC